MTTQNENTNRPETQTFNAVALAAEVGTRYSENLLILLGAGAFGLVFSASDDATGETVSIKKVHREHKPNKLKRIFREIYILKRVKHRNIIALSDIFYRSSSQSFYLVYAYMSTGLRKFIEGCPEQMSSERAKWWTQSLLRGLKCIHSAKVIHRDIKPDNILVDLESNLKICDFGLARIVDAPQMSTNLTQCVVTRGYRAPEVTLSPGRYNQAIDIWSVGCVFGEMLRCQPLFPAKSDLEEVSVILTVLGTPALADLSCFSEAARNHVLGLPTTLKRPWAEVVGEQEPSVYALLDTLLAFLPDNRPTATAALTHPYFDVYREYGDKGVCAQPLTADLEMENLSTPALLHKITQEIDNFTTERNAAGAAH